ncbi:MAG: DUF3078 domain-containing protein [Paludibacter sp.]|jgi:hypothetical protein|nr:DUF3078 domain-containing protein [Paludibacter sp.]
MDKKVLFVIVLICFSGIVKAGRPAELDSLVIDKSMIYDLDSLLDVATGNKTISDKISVDTTRMPEVLSNAPAIEIPQTVAEAPCPDIHLKLENLVLNPADSLLLIANPLFIDLVYKKEPSNFDWRKQLYPYTFFFGKKPNVLYQKSLKTFEIPTVTESITALRANALKNIAITASELIVFRYENLPGTEKIKGGIMNGRGYDDLKLVNIANLNDARKSKPAVPKIERNPWTKKASTMIQFSQNFVSDNWYQGGSKSVAILGILNGQLNYDDKKNIQWDNNGEWRMGFNSVDGAIRPLNTNDDIFRINSKLGIKAGGKWFYSGSVDFSTQFFHNYKSITSTEMKATFLSPVRLNVGVGLDYKYKKLFSLMLSPVSYKYIYVDDIELVNPNLFGIATGEKVLSEVGSSFKALLSYAPAKEIQLDSKLSFYTNYEKVEVDWEIVTNFTINRFLSTRLSLNPRYDNTQILAAGKKSKIQFKELLSFGISYKFLN